VLAAASSDLAAFVVKNAAETAAVRAAGRSFGRSSRRPANIVTTTPCRKTLCDDDDGGQLDYDRSFYIRRAARCTAAAETVLIAAPVAT